MLLGEILLVEEQVGIAENPVERRPDLMAHGGEELGLGAIGDLGFVLCRPQLLLGEPAIRDVLIGREPAAGVEGNMRDQNGAAVREALNEAAAHASRDEGRPLPVDLVGTPAAVIAQRGAHRHDRSEMDARPDRFRRKAVNLAEPLVAHHQTAVGVVHAQAVRHVAESGVELLIDGFDLALATEPLDRLLRQDLSWASLGSDLIPVVPRGYVGAGVVLRALGRGLRDALSPRKHAARAQKRNRPEQKERRESTDGHPTNQRPRARKERLDRLLCDRESFSAVGRDLILKPARQGVVTPLCELDGLGLRELLGKVDDPMTERRQRRQPLRDAVGAAAGPVPASVGGSVSRQSLDLVADLVEGTAAVRDPWAVELRRSASDDPAMLLEQQLKAGRPLDATGGTGMKAARRRFGERREVDRYSGERADRKDRDRCDAVQPRRHPDASPALRQSHRLNPGPGCRSSPQAPTSSVANAIGVRSGSR